MSAKAAEVLGEISDGAGGFDEVDMEGAGMVTLDSATSQPIGIIMGMGVKRIKLSELKAEIEAEASEIPEDAVSTEMEVGDE